MNDVFHHHQRSVDDDAEVKRPEAKQIGGYSGKYMQMNANRRESGIVMAVSSAARTLPRNRNKTKDNNEQAFEQRVRYSMQSVCDQIPPVVYGADTDALRQAERH